MCDYPMSTAASAKKERDYRAESDQRTLMSAAEVVADSIRMKAAMGLMNQSRRGIDKMLGILTSRRTRTAKLRKAAY